MQYGLAFNYVTARTGGFTNLLLITVSNLIPVVGPIIGLGYRSEVAVALLRDEERLRHPKFDFNRFGEYLSRGIWPFLIGLIMAVILVVMIMMSFGLGLAIATIQAETGIVVAIVLYVGSIFAVSMFSAPMRFHAELTNKFDFMEALHFSKSMWLTIGAQMILSWLLFVPLAFFVVLLGLLLCFVGVYPAASLVQMAGQHIMVQLYDEYLERGGEPIREYQPPELDDEDQDEDEPRPRKRRRREREDDEYEDE